VAGDYYQVVFEAVPDAYDLEQPYLMVQRQFEMPDRGRCYVEMHDQKYIGHFRIRRFELSVSSIVLEIDRPKDNIVKVTFAIAACEFEELTHVVGVINGDLEAQ
jgi:hypothetical protein